jgi:hypothetical protein
MRKGANLTQRATAAAPPPPPLLWDGTRPAWLDVLDTRYESRLVTHRHHHHHAAGMLPVASRWGAPCPRCGPGPTARAAARGAAGPPTASRGGTGSLRRLEARTQRTPRRTAPRRTRSSCPPHPAHTCPTGNYLRAPSGPQTLSCSPHGPARRTSGRRCRAVASASRHCVSGRAMPVACAPGQRQALAAAAAASSGPAPRTSGHARNPGCA